LRHRCFAQKVSYLAQFFVPDAETHSRYPLQSQCPLSSTRTTCKQKLVYVFIHFNFIFNYNSSFFQSYS